MTEPDYRKARAYPLSMNAMHFLYDARRNDDDCREFPESEEKILIGIPEDRGEGKIRLECAVKFDLKALILLRKIYEESGQGFCPGINLLREFYLDFFEYGKPGLLKDIEIDGESSFGYVELGEDVRFVIL